MKTMKLKPQVLEFERSIIRATLEKIPCRKDAARLLGITTETIRKKLLGK